MYCKQEPIIKCKPKYLKWDKRFEHLHFISVTIFIMEFSTDQNVHKLS